MTRVGRLDARTVIGWWLKVMIDRTETNERITALIIVLAGFGLLAGLTGSQAPLRVGAGVVVFISVLLGAGVWANNRAARSTAPDPHGKVARLDRSTCPALVFPISAVGQRLVIPLLGATAVLALVLASDPWPPSVPPWFFLASAGLLASLAVSKAWHWGDRPLLALTPTGITLQLIGSSTYVPWDAIVNVAIRGPIATLAITLDPAVPCERRGPPSLLGWLDSPAPGHVLRVPVASLPIEPETLARVVRHYWLTPAERHRLGTDPEPMTSSIAVRTA